MCQPDMVLVVGSPARVSEKGASLREPGTQHVRQLPSIEPVAAPGTEGQEGAALDDRDLPVGKPLGPIDLLDEAIDRYQGVAVADGCSAPITVRKDPFGRVHGASFLGLIAGFRRSAMSLIWARVVPPLLEVVGCGVATYERQLVVDLGPSGGRFATPLRKIARSATLATPCGCGSLSSVLWSSGVIRDQHVTCDRAVLDREHEQPGFIQGSMSTRTNGRFSSSRSRRASSNWSAA